MTSHRSLDINIKNDEYNLGRIIKVLRCSRWEVLSLSAGGQGRHYNGQLPWRFHQLSSEKSNKRNTFAGGRLVELFVQRGKH